MKCLNSPNFCSTVLGLVFFIGLIVSAGIVVWGTGFLIVNLIKLVF